MHDCCLRTASQRGWHKLWKISNAIDAMKKKAGDRSPASFHLLCIKQSVRRRRSSGRRRCICIRRRAGRSRRCRCVCIGRRRRCCACIRCRRCAGGRRRCTGICRLLLIELRRRRVLRRCIAVRRCLAVMNPMLRFRSARRRGAIGLRRCGRVWCRGVRYSNRRGRRSRRHGLRQRGHGGKQSDGGSTAQNFRTNVHGNILFPGFAFVAALRLKRFSK